MVDLLRSAGEVLDQARQECCPEDWQQWIEAIMYTIAYEEGVGLLAHAERSPVEVSAWRQQAEVWLAEHLVNIKEIW